VLPSHDGHLRLLELVIQSSRADRTCGRASTRDGQFDRAGSGHGCGIWQRTSSSTRCCGCFRHGSSCCACDAS